MHSERIDLAKIFAQNLSITTALSPPEWAESNIVLSSDSGTARPGPLRLSAPQRGILDAYGDDHTQRICIVGGAQVSKTTMTLAMILYSIATEPNRMLVVCQDGGAAEDLSIKRITPLIRDCPAITPLFAPAKSRDSGNTILDKQFRGGSISFVTQNAPNQLRGKSIKYLYLEEVSAWGQSSGTQGNPVSLALQRTNTHKRCKIVANSTPSIKGSCEIEKLWEQSDKREFFVPCPHCHEPQVLDWRNKDESYRVRWDRDANDRPLYHTARYYCPHCHEPWTDTQRLKAISRGEWRATAPAGQWVGFRLPSLLSDMISLERIAAEWDAARHDRYSLQSFVNNKLAEWWDEAGDKPNTGKLIDRTEEYTPDNLPNDICAITVGFDGQGDRFEYEVVGWGKGMESWSIDYGVIPFDATDPQAWVMITAQLERQYTREDGIRLRPMASCLDIGGSYTKDCADQATKINRPKRKLLAIMGSNRWSAPVWPTTSSQTRHKRTFFYVGVSQAKSQIYAALSIQPDLNDLMQIKSGKAWLCHFPAHYTAHYFDMLTAEEKRSTLDKSSGQTKFHWHCPSGKRNEALDCRAYALAALYSAGLNSPESMERQAKIIARRLNPPTSPTEINTSGQIPAPGIQRIGANNGNNGIRRL